MSRAQLLFVIGFTALARGAANSPSLSNGVISYMESGRSHVIKLLKPCSDLWVSPDESVIAFITLEKTRTVPREAAPFIEESSIYVARRSESYRPVRLPIEAVQFEGTNWRVFRQPSVGPDRQTVYFLIPFSMTTWMLFRFPLPDGPEEELRPVMTYCVVWGGEYSGDLLTLHRVEASPTDPNDNVAYHCFVSKGAEPGTLISNKCWMFSNVSAGWASARGGSCRITP